MEKKNFAIDKDMLVIKEKQVFVIPKGKGFLRTEGKIMNDRNELITFYSIIGLDQFRKEAMEPPRFYKHNFGNEVPDDFDVIRYLDSSNVVFLKAKAKFIDRVLYITTLHNDFLEEARNLPVIYQHAPSDQIDNTLDDFQVIGYLDSETGYNKVVEYLQSY